MSGQKLAKRLRRELKAHPKKAAVLGLLAVGALWFWGPLVWCWVAREPVARVTSAGKASAVAAAASSREHKESACSWEQIVARREGDPRTRPVTKLPGRPDPFHPVVAKNTLSEQQRQAKAEKEVNESKIAAATPDPQSLGMVLSSTIVGPQRRVALVNGKAYAEGRTLVLMANDQPIAFRFARIHPKGVVLERNGKTFEVSLPDRKATGRMEVLTGQN